MFLINSAMVDLPIGTAGLVSLLGYAVVFVGLIALMIVIKVEGKISVASKKQAASPVTAPAAAPAVKAQPALATGTAGELKLHNVPAKDAAIVMAIVAYKLGKPLNELRFKSIKEVQ